MTKKKRYVDPEGYCIICGFKGVDIHHIKTRKSGGKDVSWNLIKLCHPHHQEVHTLKDIRMSEKYWEYYMFLVNNGWERCPITGKWFHPIQE